MQSNRLAAVALLTACGIGLSAQGGVEKAQLEIDAAEVKGDKTAYARLLADDFTWVSATGRLRDKKTVVNDLQPATGTPGKSVGIDVRPYQAGAAMVFTRHQPDGSQVRVLRVWVQRGNAWQLVTHQGTPAGDKPVPAATAPSSPLPPNSGPAAEIKAIEAAISSLAVGNSKGDAKNFAASVTDGFVAVGGDGIVSKQSNRATRPTPRCPGAGCRGSQHPHLRRSGRDESGREECDWSPAADDRSREARRTMAARRHHLTPIATGK